MEEKEKTDLQNDKDNIVFAGDENNPTAKDNTSEQSPASPEAKPEKKKNRNTLIIAGSCAAAAIVCIGAVAAIIALNANKNTAEADSLINGPEISETYASVPKFSFPSDDTLPSDISENIRDGSRNSSTPSEVSGKESKQESKTDEEKKFGDNISIEGVDVSGLTLEKAYDVLQNKLLSLREPVYISVMCNGNTFKLNQNDMIYDTDLSEVLQDAYLMSNGKQDDSEFDYTVTDGHIDFSLNVTLSQDSIGTAVDKIKNHFDTPAVNASVKTFNPKEVEKFTYQDGRDGNVIDRTELENYIREIFEKDEKAGSFSVSLKKEKFSVTLADIKANTKLIASHYTTAANVYNSNYNMQLALLSANGTVLQPGEVFSFNQTTGNTENGDIHYYPYGVTGGYLPSIAYKKDDYGNTITDSSTYGGGICQASTTLFVCAMKAGLQAVKRYPHAYASSYADRGLDATIDYYSGLDMQFKNTLKYPVYIATYVYDYNGDGLNELMVEFYGPLSTEYDEVVAKGWVSSADYYEYYGKGAQIFFKNGKEIKRVFLPVNNSYSYKYDSYYYVSSLIPADPVNGPVVSPTMTAPTVYSPGGCGSSAPIPYGTAAEYLKKIKEQPSKQESSKEESSKHESSKEESSKQESSKQESSKQESSKQESSKQESSKQESSKQESSKQESSKQESSKQESSKQESSKQESSKQESSKQESSKQESSKQESSKQESSKQESSKQESSKQESSKQEISTESNTDESSVTETTIEEID